MVTSSTSKLGGINLARRNVSIVAVRRQQHASPLRFHVLLAYSLCGLSFAADIELFWHGSRSMKTEIIFVLLLRRIVGWSATIKVSETFRIGCWDDLAVLNESILRDDRFDDGQIFNIFNNYETSGARSPVFLCMRVLIKKHHAYYFSFSTTH